MKHTFALFVKSNYIFSQYVLYGTAEKPVEMKNYMQSQKA